MTNPSCPDDDSLLSVVLSESTEEELAAHATTCTVCQERLARFDKQVRALRDVAGQLAEPAEEAPARPTVIGKYLIIGPIAEGGQAAVFRAMHPTLGKDLAIKLGRHPVDRQQQAEHPLVREARLLAELDHPNLVRVYDFDYHEGRPYLVMEYVRGRNLEQRAKDEPFSPRAAAAVVAQAARALAAAHRRGILHQDIKPGNILIDETGKPRLGDFGLARFRDAYANAQEQPVGGTPGFMAPEQATSDPARIRQAIDIFGLGGVLYFLLTREMPTAGLGEPAKLDPAALQAAPSALAAVCRRALAHDPADRYPSADALAADLDRYLKRPCQLKLLALAAAALAAILLLAWIWPKPEEPMLAPLDQIPVVLENASLQARVPLEREERFFIQCDVPKGYAVAVYLLDEEGTVTPLPKPTINPGETLDTLKLGPLNVKGHKGTNLVLVCADRDPAAIAPASIQPHLEALQALPDWPEPMVYRVGRDRVKDEWDQTRGFQEAPPRSSDQVRLKLEQLRRQLRERCRFFAGVAFTQKGD